VADAVKEILLCCHERYDAKGYPRQLPKDRVSIRSKIVSMVSAFDAIISERAFSKAKAATDAFRILNKGKGSKYDPELLELFLKWLGMYLVGSLVEMQTGEIGFVLSNHPRKKFSPRLMLVTDENKKTGVEKIIDLNKLAVHSSGVPYEIKRGLPERTLAISTQHYLDEAYLNVPAWCKMQDSNKTSPFSKFIE
jgi:hypothetical protein